MTDLQRIQALADALADASRAAAENLTALQALLQGFADGTFTVTKKRWADSEPYDATLQAARTIVAKSSGEATND
jgi:hypothetical protein